MDESPMNDLLLADLPPSGRMSPSDNSMGSVDVDFDFLGPSDSGASFVAHVNDSRRPNVPPRAQRQEKLKEPQDLDFVPISPSSSSNLVSLACLVHLASEECTVPPADIVPDAAVSSAPVFPTYVSAKRKHVEIDNSELALLPQEVSSYDSFDFLQHLDEALIVTDDDYSHDEVTADPQGPSVKKTKFEETTLGMDSPPTDDPIETLHLACAQVGQSCVAIKNILKADSAAARRPGKVVVSTETYDYKTASLKTIQETCPYRYALNVAIKHGADSSILKTLVRAAPKVLKQLDGNEESPLHILMRYKPEDSETTKALLSHCIELVTFTDAKGNTPLHTLAMWAKPNSLKIIRLFCHLNPHALRQRNFNGLTPVDVAQQQSKCPEDIASYLRQRAENHVRTTLAAAAAAAAAGAAAAAADPTAHGISRQGCL